MFQDIMVDLETLGVNPGCSIISIGAIAFSPQLHPDNWRRFYSGPISRNSCQALGLEEEHDTVKWWQNQASEAREVFERASSANASSIRKVLMDFREFFPKGTRIWGNGASFDEPILSMAYKAATIRPPWIYSDSRCYRTMFRMFPKVLRSDFVGIKHNAVDDAMNQALHLVKIMREIQWQG